MPSLERYSSMPYNRCGNSGIHLPAVSLGLWQNWGAEDSYLNASEMILTAFDRGITHFDLANNYGPPRGAAEETFGRILKQNLASHRDELLISTKAGHLMWEGPYGTWGSRKHLIASLDQSLKRLGIDYVDIFYHHRPDPDTPLEETVSALEQIIRSGRALYLGISRYHPGETAAISSLLHQNGHHCLVHQPRYHLMDRTIENGLLDVLQAEGIGCIVYSPLAQGLLSDKYLETIPAESRAGKGGRSLPRESIDEVMKGRLNRLNAIAGDRGQSLAQMAVQWVLRQKQVTSALIGASLPGQIVDIVDGLCQNPLSGEDLKRIDATLDQ